MSAKIGIKSMFSAIIVILSIILANCQLSERKGFVLQRFKVVNNQLESIILGIKDSTHMLNEEGYIKILVLRIYDSIPEFHFTSSKKEDISELYIFANNRRIIGYVDDNGMPIIVLSTDCNKYEFESTFYDFLIPTEENKYFEYIYFPDNQYSVNRDGRPNPPPIFDPYYYHFAYKGNKMVSVSYDN